MNTNALDLPSSRLPLNLAAHASTRGFITVMLLLLASLPTQARSIYVSTTGSNAGTGTATQPYRTVGHAITNAVPGDHLYVEGGNYVESDILLVAKAITLHGWNGVATINVADLTPPPSLYVDPGSNQVIALGAEAYLDGEVGVNDVDGEPLVTSRWTLVSGNPDAVHIRQPSSEATYVQITNTGTFVFQLTVEALGMTASSNVTVSVVPDTDGPGGSGFRVNAGTDAVLTGVCDCRRTPQFQAQTRLSGTMSGAGATAVRSWELLAGPSSVDIDHPDQLQTDVTFSEPGCYRFRLTVTATNGDSRSDEVFVQVKVAAARTYLQVSGAWEPTGGAISPGMVTYLRNTHACASIAFVASNVWLHGQLPAIGVGRSMVSGTLAPLERRVLHAGDASVQIVSAAYVSGCGAGHDLECDELPPVRQATLPRPELVTLRAPDFTPALIVQTVYGVTNVIESSTNLRDWTPVTRVIGDETPYLLMDPARGHTQRFYRARTD